MAGDAAIFGMVQPLKYQSPLATLGEIATYKEKQQQTQIQQAQLAEYARKLTKEQSDQATTDQYNALISGPQNAPGAPSAPPSPAPAAASPGMAGLPGGAPPDGSAPPMPGTAPGTPSPAAPVDHIAALRELVRTKTPGLLAQFDKAQQEAADKAAVTKKAIEDASEAHGKAVAGMEDYVGSSMIPPIKQGGYQPLVANAAIDMYADHFKGMTGTDLMVSRWRQAASQGPAAIQALVEQYQAAHDARHPPTETTLAMRAAGTEPPPASGAPPVSAPPSGAPTAGPMTAPPSGPPPTGPMPAPPTAPASAGPATPPPSGPPPGPGGPPPAPTAGPPPTAAPPIATGDPQAVRAWALLHPNAPGEAADAARKVTSNAAGFLGANARTQAGYTAAYATLDPTVARQFPTPQQWTPQTGAQVRQLGMTPDQQVTTGQQATYQTGELRLRGGSEAETARHNRVTESAANPFGTFMGAGAPSTGGPTPTGAPSGPSPLAGTPATGPTGDAFLKTLPPAIATQVKSYAEGRQAFPSGMALRTPYFQQMLQAVGQYDPSFDATNFNGRNKARGDFTAGASAKQITALNTVVGHLGDLSEKAGALGNTSLPTYNGLKNWVSRELGSSAVTNFDTVKKGVTDELTRVWRGAGGSEADIKSWAENLSSAQSPEQLTGAFSTISGMLGARLDALENQKQQGLGRFGQDIQIVTPKSKATLARLQGTAPATAGAGGQVVVTAPDGSTHPFATQTQADAFKKLAGIP